MKKTFIIVLAMVLMFSLAACGAPAAENSPGLESDQSGAPVDTASEAPETVEGRKKIGVAVGSATDVWATYWMAAVETYAEEFPGYEFIFVDAGDYNLANQIAQVEDFINNGVSAIIMIPADASASGNITEACQSAGVPLIVAQIKLTNQEEATALAASDAYEGGLLQAQYVMETMMGGEGKVVVLQGKAGNDNAKFRYQAALETEEKNPGIEIVATDIGNWERSEALRIMETWIQSGIEFDCVLAGNDEMAIGASIALQNAGMREGKIIAGFDATTEGLDAIVEGAMDVTLQLDAVGQAKAAVELAIAAVEGTMTSNETMVPSTVITKDNVQDFVQDVGSIKN